LVGFSSFLPKKGDNKNIDKNLIPQFYPLNEENKTKLIQLRNIYYSQLNQQQQSIIVQDGPGVICLLYKLKGETKLYQRWNPESKEYKYLVGKGTTPKDTFALAGLNTLKTNSDLWIVEGFFDMICMQLSGFNCVSKFNARANSDLVAQWIIENHESFKDIYIALDSDKDGQFGTDSLIKELVRLKYDKRLYRAIMKLPEHRTKFDANDIWNTGESVSFNDFEINEIDILKEGALEETNVNEIEFLSKPDKSETEKAIKSNSNSFGLLPVLGWEDIAEQKEPELVPNPFGLPIEKQAMTLICALSGHGKTTALLNLTVGMAELGQKSLYIMLEERPLTILAKMQSIYLDEFTDEITSKKKDFNLIGFHTKIIKSNEEETILIPERAYPKLQEFKSLVSAGTISIMDATGQDIDMICNSISSVFEYQKYDSILIDYIQNVKPSNSKSNQVRQIQLASISSQLAPLANKLDTALIVGAQFRRDVESLEEMDLAKIREAGDIGQDSHLAVGLWNHSDPTKNSSTELRNEVTMRCLKVRGSRFKDITMKTKYLTWHKNNHNEVFKNKTNSETLLKNNLN
jgi:hypothetical protein